MKQSVINLIERLLNASRLVGDDMFWTVLAIALVIASIHLLAMLVTRWGERSITPKALLFSILVHGVCLFVLVTIQRQPSLMEAAIEEPIPIPVKEIFVRGEDEFFASEKGNSPVWEKLPEVTSTPLIRSERSPNDAEPEKSEVPERQTESLAPPRVELADKANLPEESKTEPKAEVQAEPVAPKEAEEALKVEEQAAEKRDEPQIAAKSRARADVDRPGQIEANVSRDTNAAGDAQRNSSNRDADRIDLSQSTSPREIQVDAKPTVERAGDTDSVANDDRSTPVAVPDAEAGGDAYETKPAPAGAPQFASRIGRTATSGVGNSGEGGGTEESAAAPVRRSRALGNSAGNSTVDIGDRAAGPRNAVQGDSPRPRAERPNLDGDPAGRFPGSQSTYRLRGLENRKSSARKYGGTDSSERAVELSLRWLAQNQTKDGYWDSEQHGGGSVKLDADGKDTRGVELSDGIPGKKANAGVTALAILAFLGAGYTHEEGQYAEVVQNALDWLIRNQRKDGFLGGDATYYESMYCHAMATYAMAEAFGMQSDPSVDTGLREPLSRAVSHILSNQNPDGGWRYRKGQQSDMSMFGWQLMALKSADIAGIKIPGTAVKQMREFLAARSLGQKKGLAGYAVSLVTNDPMPPTASMTAEALFCKQMLGVNRSSPACTEAVDYLMQRLPKRSETNLYYWYYATLAMYQYGGKEWLEWNAAIRDELVATQITSGDTAGSWDPRCVWGPYGGRIYSTAISTLCLEVYYRFLPLYNLSSRPKDR